MRGGEGEGRGPVDVVFLVIFVGCLYFSERYRVGARNTSN